VVKAACAGHEFDHVLAAVADGEPIGRKEAP
jgi:hypothetical protein